MFCTVPGNPARCDFSPFGGEIPKCPRILVINFEAAVRTELADFSSVKSPSEPIFIIIIASTLRSIVRHFLPLRHFLFRTPVPSPLLLQSPRVQPLRIVPPPPWPLMLQGPQCH